MSYFENLNFDELITFLTPYLAYIMVALIVLLLLKLFHFKAKTILKMLINILIGGVILFFINSIPGVNVELDIWKSLAVGIFGIPAVIVILVIYFFF